MSETIGCKMIVDTGPPLIIVSKKWLKKYIGEKAVNEKDLECRNCLRILHCGEDLYLIMNKFKFTIVVKVEEGDYIKRVVKSNYVDKNKEFFLCGRKILTE